MKAKILFKLRGHHVFNYLVRVMLYRKPLKVAMNQDATEH